MIQRKCGTCKYFEEGGIASSGWCRHPERQELEHMVLVRKTELACRNGWDDDLWEPRNGYAEANSSTDISASTCRPHSTTVTSRNGQRSGVAAERDSDTVVAPAATRGHPEYEAGTQTSTSYRNGEVPGRRKAPRALEAWSSAFAADRTEPSTEVDEFQGESVVSQVRTHVEDGHEHTGRRSQHGTTDHVPAPDSPAFPAGYREEKQSDRRFDESQTAPDERKSDDDQPRVQQSGITEQFDVEPEEAGQISDASAVQDVKAESPAGATATGIPDDDRSDEPPRLPMAVQTKACCRNCRDFLPSEGGLRGWCNNPFAFSKRHEVRGDSLACQSTVGSWWSPSDDWWMERADIAHHSAPTPLVDNLIRQIRMRELEERGSTEERGRS